MLLFFNYKHYGVSSTGTNDENTFTPRPRKQKPEPQLYVPVVESQEERIVEEVILPAIEKVEISLTQIQNEKIDEKITQKANEIAVFIESPKIQAAFSAVSNLNAKKLQEKISLEVESLVTELKEKRLAIQAKQVEEEIAREKALVDYKQSQLIKLETKLKKAEYEKQLALQSQLESDLANQLTAIDHKRNQLEKLLDRINEANRLKRKYSDMMDEEEVALFYLLLDS